MSATGGIAPVAPAGGLGQVVGPGQVGTAPKRAGGGFTDIIRQAGLMYFAFYVVGLLTSRFTNSNQQQQQNATTPQGGAIAKGGRAITPSEALRLTEEKALSQRQQQEYLTKLMGAKSGMTVPPAGRVFPTVDDSGRVLGPHTQLLPKDSLVRLQVYVSEQSSFRHGLPLIWEVPSIAYNWSFAGAYDGFASFPLTPDFLAQNRTLFAHVFLLREGDSLSTYDAALLVPPDDEAAFAAVGGLPTQLAYRRFPLVRHRAQRRPKVLRHLLGAGADQAEAPARAAEGAEDEGEPLPSKAYWTPLLNITLVLDMPTFPRNAVPPPIVRHVAFTALGDVYPLLHRNEFWQLSKHLPEVNASYPEIHNSSSLPLHLSLSCQSFFVWQMQTSLEDQWASQRSAGTMGSDDRESDMFRELLLDTNPWLLGVTAVVSLLHTLFDFLAFKNDVQFWRKKKSMTGMSVRGLFVNCFFQTIILLYLFDNDTSPMILFSSSIGLLIEYWKLGKAFNLSVSGWRPVLGGAVSLPCISYGLEASYRQKQGQGEGQAEGEEEVEEDKGTTEVHDRFATTHLLYVCLPLSVGYSLYSLVHATHKSFYSWLLGSLVGFVYAFGFILMTPQLWINYKLKSVAHMPWKAMVYKALNTFIDDLFAFVIKMPTLHRLACLRDDVIFIIYLYQKWIYPVDHARVNEFGQGGDDAGAGAGAGAAKIADAGSKGQDLFAVVRAELEAAGVKPSPEQEQHFLCSRDKLKLLSSAVAQLCSGGEVGGSNGSAASLPGPVSVVMELGAGAGSVARSLSPSASQRLILVELDAKLCRLLRGLNDAGAFAGWKDVEVIEGDAISALSKAVSAQDNAAAVVVSSLPSSLTQAVLQQMSSRPGLRGCVMAASAKDAEILVKGEEKEKGTPLSFTKLCTLAPEDFEPPQRGIDAALLLVTPAPLQ